MDKFFRDKKGNLVIAQPPNKWVYISALGYVGLRSFEDSGHIDIVGFLMFYGAGFYWSWLELSEGKSNWRKLLGVVVAIILLKSIWGRML